MNGGEERAGWPVTRADFLAKLVGPAGAVLYLPDRPKGKQWRVCADRKQLKLQERVS